MFDKVAELLSEADDCRANAVQARTAEERAAWFDLADEWLRLAREMAQESGEDRFEAELTF
jgi:hypothetical protein